MNTYVKVGLVALAALIFIAEISRSNKPWRVPQDIARYVMVGGGNGRAYVLDTVTGMVSVCTPVECWDLEYGEGPFTETEE